jgi:hypothetical protein
MARPHEIAYVAQNLREADRREACRITNSDNAVRAVRDSVVNSRFTLVGLESGTTPVAIAGVSHSDDYPHAGIPWLVGTDRISEKPVQFLRKARSVLAQMFEISGYEIFYNVVDAENDVHQQWLRWVGASFADDPIQINGYDFFQFTIRRQ